MVRFSVVMRTTGASIGAQPVCSAHLSTATSLPVPTDDDGSEGTGRSTVPAMHALHSRYRLGLIALLATVNTACVSGLLPMARPTPPASSGGSDPEAEQLRTQCLTRTNETARRNNGQRVQTYAIGFAMGGVSSILAGLSASAATPDAQRALGPAAVYVPAGISAALALVIPVLTSNARADVLTREWTTLSNELEQSDDLATSADPSDTRRRGELLRRCARGHNGFSAPAAPAQPPTVVSSPPPAAP
jgi:hypothetical protein